VVSNLCLLDRFPSRSSHNQRPQKPRSVTSNFKATEHRAQETVATLLITGDETPECNTHSLHTGAVQLLRILEVRERRKLGITDQTCHESHLIHQTQTHQPIYARRMPEKKEIPDHVSWIHSLPSLGYQGSIWSLSEQWDVLIKKKFNASTSQKCEKNS
jgi:hypothetical protein